MRVLVIDDHPILRLGVQQLIHRQWPDAEIVEAETIELARTAAVAAPFDVIVLDLVMPDVSGAEGVTTMLSVAGTTPILVLSFNTESNAVRLLQMGVAGYLQKDRATDELVTALQRVLSGKRYVTESMADRLVDLLGSGSKASAPAHELLSTQEHRVMLMLAEGQPPAEIGAALGISARTVATYRTRIFEKTGWKSNVQLAKYCLQHGLTGHIG